MNSKRITAAMLALLSLSALTACGKEEPKDSAPTGIAVQVTEVQSDTISSETSVSGQVASDNESIIVVPTNAKCTSVRAKAGDVVSAGAVLCTLDLGSTLASYHAADISYSSAVQSYQEQAAVLDSQIALYEKSVKDLKALFEIGAASQLEIDQAELQLQTAKATRNSTLSQLEAGMQNAKSGLDQLSSVLEYVDEAGNVIAPISGTLVAMNAVAGNFISSSSPVAVIDGVDQMKIQVAVSESLVPKLRIGDTADVSVSAAKQKFSAKIRTVERAANVQTKLYNVTLSVPKEAAKDLLAGMFAEVTFHTDTAANTIVIPTESILNRGESQYVYVVEKDNHAKCVEITTGLAGNGVTEVTSGLSTGQKLVTVGQFYLQDGDLVRIVTDEEASKEKKDAQKDSSNEAKDQPDSKDAATPAAEG